MLAARVRTETDRFYDGGVLPAPGRNGEPPDPTSPPRIVLEREAGTEPDRFALERRIAYRDRQVGELLVPAGPDFRTDLTSTPRIFLWLVPRTGAHLPAALLHDGLVDGPGGGSSYTSTEGHTVDRVEADRIFRDAMADTGTGVLRRWIAWSAVVLASFFVGGGTPWSTLRRWRYRVAAVGTLGLVCWLGWSATADLVDVAWPLAVELPWMGDRSFALELVGGLAGAIVVPLVLSLAWGRFRSAGAIAGVMLAVLLHVTVGIVAILAGYQLAERLVDRAPYAALALAAGLVTASAVVCAVMTLG